MAATLLFADDSLTMQRVVELTFADEGIRVVMAADGDAATARLVDDRPDIVLADVGLPGVDGYQIAQRVRRSSELASVPVLLLAGAFEPVDEVRARAAGCDGIVVKPFEPRQLLKLVTDLLAGNRPDTLWPRAEPAMAPVREPLVPGNVSDEIPAFTLDDLDSVLSRRDSPESQEPAVEAPFVEQCAVDAEDEVTIDLQWDLPTPAPVVEMVETPAGLAVEPAQTPVPTLATAFAALLSAERSQAGLRPSSEPAGGLSEAAVEEVVRRVVARMTDEVVQNLVAETAERYIREELDRLKF